MSEAVPAPFSPQPAQGLNFAHAVDLFSARVASDPDAPALRFKEGHVWRTLSWRDWEHTSRQLAAALIRHYKIAPGDRVAMMAKTRVEWALMDLAIALTGAVSVPIYPTVMPAEVGLILGDSDCVLALVDTPETAERLLAAGPDAIAALRGLIVFDGIADQPALLGTGLPSHAGLGETELAAIVGFEAVRSHGGRVLAQTREELHARRLQLGLASEFTCVYTSGTTGRPKGVVLTHKNIVFEAWAVRSVIPVDRGDEQLMVLPLAHIFARHLLWCAVDAGVVTAFAVSPSKLGENLMEVAPTFVGGVPELFARVHRDIQDNLVNRGVVSRGLFYWCLDVGREVGRHIRRGQAIPGALALKKAVADRVAFDPIKQRFGGRIRFLISGGAALGVELAEFFHATGLQILEGYGLTETTGAVHVNRPGRFRFGTVGPALPGVDVRIADDGEILVRGHCVMAGYHKLPAETAAVIDQEGWFHTGDLGKLEAGFLRITGRKKEIIVTSTGKNVAPAPIEHRLEEHPLIAHAMVAGDDLPRLVALIGLDVTHAQAISKREGFGASAPEELARHPKIRERIQNHVDEINAELAHHEQIKRFAISLREFSEAAGELTPTQKLRRSEVWRMHGSLLTGVAMPMSEQSGQGPDISGNYQM